MVMVCLVSCPVLLRNSIRCFAEHFEMNRESESEFRAQFPIDSYTLMTFRTHGGGWVPRPFGWTPVHLYFSQTNVRMCWPFSVIRRSCVHVCVFRCLCACVCVCVFRVEIYFTAHLNNFLISCSVRLVSVQHLWKRHRVVWHWICLSVVPWMGSVRHIYRLARCRPPIVPGHIHSINGTAEHIYIFYWIEGWGLLQEAFKINYIFRFTFCFVFFSCRFFVVVF